MSQTPDPVVPPTRLVNQALAVFSNFLDVIYCNLSSGLPPHTRLTAAHSRVTLRNIFLGEDMVISASSIPAVAAEPH